MKEPSGPLVRMFPLPPIRVAAAPGEDTRPLPEVRRDKDPAVAPTALGAAPSPRLARENLSTHRHGTPRPGSSHELCAGARIGQYEIIRSLGQGGMGAVYLARDLRLGRRVAIKFLLTQSAWVDEQFLAEARATARCQHEHIVVIHDVGEHHGRPYMVLEYLRGQTLAAWHDGQSARFSRRSLPDPRNRQPLTGGASPDGGSHRPRDARTPVPPAQAAEVMVPVVRALVHAHELGIVHRDLKPSNIVLSDSGTIKVLDFGIAKLVARSNPGRGPMSDLTPLPGPLPGAISDSTLAGTPAYMAPEQLECQPVDHRADLWAVGVMLFELVMGHHPLPSLDAASLLAVSDLDVPMPSVREHCPQLGAMADVVDRCLIKDRARRTGSARELLGELEALLPRHQSTAHGDDGDGDPFAGLAAFQERDAERFFGRDREIASLTARLRSQPLVAIAGPSGTGKSSVVRAGVIPALKRSGQGWDVHILRPGRRPLWALIDLLVDLAGLTSGAAGTHPDLTASGDAASAASDPIAVPAEIPASRSACARAATREVTRSGEQRDQVRERLYDEPGLFGAALRARALERRRRALVFVDQFEELFTMDIALEEVRTFLACLDTVADDASSPLRLILSIRSDFLDRAAEHPGFMADLSQGLFFLPPLTRDGMRDALERPVQAAGYRFDDGVVPDMLDQVEAAPGALPLLQFAASHLWSSRDEGERSLTRESYDAMGGLAGALASHADQVLAAMSPAEGTLTRAVFERLVTPERTRAVVGLSELCELGRDPDAVEKLIHQLVNARLLSTEATAGGARLIELVHESLIERWPRLSRWLDENQDDAAFLARLRAAAAEWHHSGRSDGMLWRGEPARDARRWREHYTGDLADREQGFLDAVFALDARARWVKRVMIYTGLGALMLVLLVGAVALTATQQLDTIQEQEALLQERKAELERSLYQEAQARKVAEAAQQEAEQARARAAERAREAEAARDEAAAQRERALKARKRAIRQKRRAVAARDDAETQSDVAEAARRDAVRSRREAEAARAEIARQKREIQRLIEKQGIERLDLKNRPARRAPGRKAAP